MCGITAYLGDHNAFRLIYRGLEILQNRGYDSAGICTIANNNFVCSKFASSDTETGLDKLKSCSSLHDNHTIGIGHTRWATHGGKTNSNAHPHQDMHNQITLVHNGIIENYSSLKSWLLFRNYKFKSETDTEVIANLIGYYLDQDHSILESIKMAVERLEGTWGLVIMYLNTPNKLYLCKNGSPLLIGLCQEYFLIASESSAISGCEYICLDNHDIISIEFDINNRIYQRPGGLLTNTETFLHDYEVKKPNLDIISTNPDPYPHWTIKEIMEQPESIQNALNCGGRFEGLDSVHLGGLMDHVQDILSTDNLLLIGCGTSYHSGLFGSKFYKILNGFNTVQILDASEFSDIDIPISKTTIIALSQSGETKDVHRAIEVAKKYNLFICGVVNVVDSLIARESDCGVYTNAGREVAVASTKSFINQSIVLILIAIWVAQKQGKSNQIRTSIVQDLKKFSHTIRNISKVDYSDISEFLSKQDRIFLLGRGMCHSIALEAALKIKEITYIHAEGYAGGALKHGPFSLIETGTPIILFILDDEHFHRMISAAEEIKSRGSVNIVITNAPDRISEHLKDFQIVVPDSGMLSSLSCIVPIQLIAYQISCMKGLNPDQPRNLAKVVTVDG